MPKQKSKKLKKQAKQEKRAKANNARKPAKLALERAEKKQAKQVKGSVKEGVGKVTGDAKTEAEGKAEKVAGKVQNAVGSASSAPQLNETSRKRTVSAGGMNDGRPHDGAAERRGATERVWRSGARSRWADVTRAQDRGGAAAVAR